MDKSLPIGIHLCSHLMSEAIYQFLVQNGYDYVAMSERFDGFTPHVLLVDSTTLTRDLLARYPEAKVLLIDAGMETDTLCATFLSYRLHGILSPRTRLHTLKKALKAVTEGKTWIDNAAVKASLKDAETPSLLGKNSGITHREREIIAYTCQGLTNKEIARKLAISPYTVKVHLSHIFAKVNVNSRSKLIVLARQHRLARSA